MKPDDHLFLCCADGEGSHEFKVCADEAAVFAFYELMTGRDQDGTLDSITIPFRDPDQWRNEGAALELHLYCAEFTVWKVTARELALPYRPAPTPMPVSRYRMQSQGVGFGGSTLVADKAGDLVVHGDYEALERLYLEHTAQPPQIQEAYDKLAAEVSRLQHLIGAPETADFDKGVPLECAHQVERWGEAHDRSKSAENWYWLIGYLAGKALRAHVTGDHAKALHHTISAAAALRNWHKAIKSDTTGAGIGQDEDLAALESHG